MLKSWSHNRSPNADTTTYVQLQTILQRWEDEALEYEHGPESRRQRGVPRSSNDLDTIVGNWSLHNLRMKSALKFRGYDCKFADREGEHDGEHGAAILPQSSEWLGC